MLYMHTYIYTYVYVFQHPFTPSQIPRLIYCTPRMNQVPYGFGDQSLHLRGVHVVGRKEHVGPRRSRT